MLSREIAWHDKCSTLSVTVAVNSIHFRFQFKNNLLCSNLNNPFAFSLFHRLLIIQSVSQSVT